MKYKEPKTVKYTVRVFNIMVALWIIIGVCLGYALALNFAPVDIEVYNTYSNNNGQESLEYPALYPNVSMQKGSYLFFGGYAVKAN